MVAAKEKAKKAKKTTKGVTEELKLGKFERCAPLQLPEKEVKRGWQIMGAVVLMLMTIVGLAAILGFIVSVTDDGVMSMSAQIGNTPTYQLIAILMIALATMGCFVASVMMFAKKKVPAWLWYVLVVIVLIGVVSASFHRFRLYEQRRCYENYPGIIDRGYPCPDVEYELGMVVLIDVAVCLVGVGVMALIRHGSHKR